MHGVDESIDRKIREMARREHASINRTAQALLRKALGLGEGPTDHRADFQDLAGRWTSADLDEFENATADLSTVDPRAWVS